MSTLQEIATREERRVRGEGERGGGGGDGGRERKRVKKGILERSWRGRKHQTNKAYVAFVYAGA